MGSGRWAVVGVALWGALFSSGCDDRVRTVPLQNEEVLIENEPGAVPTERTDVPASEQWVPPIVDVRSGAGSVVDPTPLALGEITEPPPPPPPPPPPDAGPWPKDPVLNYTAEFMVGKPQSVGVDEGLNVWLLDDTRIGVLRPGDTAPSWVSGIGQAREGWGYDKLALRSTVICGGEAGRAYVGYWAHELQRNPDLPELQRAYIPWPGEPYYTPEKFAEYYKGDLDAVRLSPDGKIVLEEHVWRTLGSHNKDRQVGIHNTNDFHWEEDRTILACQRVTRGPHRGDVYVTTNHGATRIQGLVYSSHRHPGWYKYYLINGKWEPALQTAWMWGLGIGQNGDVLLANEQMVGALIPTGDLADWDRENTWEGPTPWRFKFYNTELNDQESHDYWRAFQQVKSGQYYLGSLEFGLWHLHARWRSDGVWTRVPGLPTQRITALAATDDGALYIGTENAGLFRMEADGATIAKVPTITGLRVRQLVYEPTVTPTMLFVLTDAGLWVIRGP